MQSMENKSLPKQFWVIGAIEVWERFGYYATQSLLALFFIKNLHYSESQSMYVFGSFFAFVFGFIWVGGQIGDRVLGAKRTIILGGITLLLSYIALFISTSSTVFYALAGVIVGNALFKANPSSLISKLYSKGDTGLDVAMTMYYMAINIGSLAALFLAPIIGDLFGYKYTFLMSAIGLLLGLTNFIVFYKILDSIGTHAGNKKLNCKALATVVTFIILSIIAIGFILPYTKICYSIVAVVAIYAFSKFLNIAFSLEKAERSRMLVAFILLLQGIIFWVLYGQMPTTLTFLAKNNINASIFGWHIPAAQYQVLNPLFILLMSPILSIFYRKYKGSHVSKFCVGMLLCALAFLILWLPQFFTKTGFISPIWIFATYWLQSTGELLISGLGLAMVAELCPSCVSGFVMGVWFITSMVAGPISAWLGSMTTPSSYVKYSPIESIHVYGSVFGLIGVIVAAISIIMLIFRPRLNILIYGNPIKEKSEFIVDQNVQTT